MIDMIDVSSCLLLSAYPTAWVMPNRSKTQTVCCESPGVHEFYEEGNNFYLRKLAAPLPLGPLAPTSN
jgi:hypothetical protein